MGTITLEKLIDFMKKNIYNRSIRKNIKKEMKKWLEK